MSIQRGRELFSKEQRKLFMKYPEDEWTIGSYYTFSKYDLETIMKHRKEENKLGFAIQLAALRYPGWSYSSNKTIPIEIIQYIANQVGTVPKALKLYSLRNNTSSSDGMRLQLGVSSLHADSNPHYGTGKGTTIYRFTSDQFSSYYSKIINTNSRDATHVLDGLLNNVTDLNIEEHYTDTAGYTDQVFALTYLLGFRFAPRIRDLSDVKLFTLNKCDKFSNLDGILKGKINEKIIKDNYDEVLRLASSIKEGTVTSSLIISKLASYSRQNSLAAALREMGKIEKTIFILDYISSEELRRKIQKGLNKGEAMNGLARAIFFGKQGELRERTMQSQLQKASALNLIINAINIWNTLYLEKAINYKESIGEYINYNLISHISPLGWEHINMLGEYTFNLNELESTELYRPLNI